MSPSRERVVRALLVLTPLLAMATLAMGLRLGASGAVHAASVFGGAAGLAPASGREAPVALQILTYVDDRSVREIVPMKGLSVRVRGAGHEARWLGDSNVDGIAEATLMLPESLLRGELDLDVCREGDPRPLAEGRVSFHGEDVARPATPSSPVRPSYRSGALGLDLFVEGERIPVGLPARLWLRVAPSSPSARVALSVSPEPGLRLTEARTEMRCEGWAELGVIADAHVLGLRVDARDREGREGAWYGAVPVAPGAFSLGVPSLVPEGKGVEVEILAPNPRSVAYAEVDDERGRVFAAALSLGQGGASGMPRARLSVPALAPGLHWLVVSGEPRGAEHMTGATLARPFWVGPPPTGELREACGLGPWLAQQAAPGFSRKLLVDGMATRGVASRDRRRLGLALGIGALGVGAALEALLLVMMARRGRERARLADGSPGGSVLVAVLLSVLGFALLACLLLAKA